MRAFVCDHCGLLLFFENSLCLRCGMPQGFVPSRLENATGSTLLAPVRTKLYAPAVLTSDETSNSTH